jgi:hypothetical protein
VTTDAAVAWLRQQVQARLETAACAADTGAWRQGYEFDANRIHGAHIALNDPRDVIARCEAELAILDFRDLAGTIASASDDGQTGERSEAQQARRRLDVLNIAVEHLASGYRYHDGYAGHWGQR